MQRVHVGCTTGLKRLRLLCPSEKCSCAREKPPLPFWRLPSAAEKRHTRAGRRDPKTTCSRLPGAVRRPRVFFNGAFARVVRAPRPGVSNTRVFRAPTALFPGSGCSVCTLLVIRTRVWLSPPTPKNHYSSQKRN